MMKEWFKSSSNIFKIFVLIFSIILISGTFFVKMDRVGDEIIDDSMGQAVKVFAVAKGLNAAISLIQGTEVGPPGVTFSVGEVLDPVNDLVEQFSWVMLASITALGIQKILLNSVVGQAFNILLIVSIIVANIWLFVRFKNDERYRNIFFKVSLVLIFLRFSIPIMAITNQYIYENYVATSFSIEKRTEDINKSTEQINELRKDESYEEKSIFGNIKKAFSSKYYEQKLEEYKKATEEVSVYITDLIIAFIFNTMFFPLVFIFLLYVLLKNIFYIRRRE